MNRLGRTVVAFLISNCMIGAICFSQSLEIRDNDAGRPLLYYEGAPCFAYGPSPQNILTYLPRGNGNDVCDWATWARKYGMSHVRSYPPHFIVEGAAFNLFESDLTQPDKFDLDRMNERYFEALRLACLLLKENGIVVHLQMWQAVTWKKNWDRCYYNPHNNVNPELSLHAGPQEFVTMSNPTLLSHQKAYVRKILDATADLGNVFYDIMNELGNGTGADQEWVKEIVNEINAWEGEHNIDVLLTLNDEGGQKLGGFTLAYDKLDLIVKDLGRYDEHSDTSRAYKKPTISVRNIDWNYQKKERCYFWGEKNLEITSEHEYQVRGRKYWWRMFMAGVQSAGAYADALAIRDIHTIFGLGDAGFRKIGHENNIFGWVIPVYRFNTITERYFYNFKKFVDTIRDYGSLQLRENIVIGHPATHTYALESRDQAVIYLESPNGAAGYSYGPQQASVVFKELMDGSYDACWYFPSDGSTIPFQTEVVGQKISLLFPSCNDDLVLHLKKETGDK
ncbi:MAG: hypothetical protein JW938_05245 [Candidatus Omnitrophica bacterium]|nr:hypothetical protein [Candidatus Omnitrophota bacterium]